MNIREALHSDISALAEVYVEAFREVDPSEVWTKEAASKLVAFLLSKQPDLAFLIEKDGRIGGGICGIIKPWWDGNHLVETELFLARWCQNQRAGTKLFAHFLEHAVEKYQVTDIESLTFKDLDFPLSWYVSLGFEPKDDWQVIFGKVDKVLCNLKKTCSK